MVYRVTSAHEEGGSREYAVSTTRFIGADKLEAIEIVEVEMRNGKFEPVAGTERVLPADLAFLALGFVGVQKGSALDQLGVEVDERGNIVRDARYSTGVQGVFVAGDAGRGQSLIVWAIAEGRSTAVHVDRYLTGSSTLPTSIAPTTKQLLA
jgi:glutamate synthase (NADPH/NADH) small chain